MECVFTVKRDAKGRLYKLRPQENGHYKEVHTWKLEELSAIDIADDGQVRRGHPMRLTRRLDTLTYDMPLDLGLLAHSAHLDTVRQGPVLEAQCRARARRLFGGPVGRTRPVEARQALLAELTRRYSEGARVLVGLGVPQAPDDAAPAASHRREQAAR